MTRILRSLDVISSGYSVFEKDQVLTHDQLNSISDYLDDQSRLTRTNLLGVGIACGLRVATQGSNVTLTRGVGITTDGDLMRFSADTVYDRFRVYNSTKPAYGPFYKDGAIPGEMLPVYELVSTAESGDSGTDLLGNFTARTGARLDDMVALLYMESYVTDRDLCSGTDCDNLGQECRNTVRLLLIGNTLIQPLQESVATPDLAFGMLDEIVADRPYFTPSVNAPGLLAQAYRATCNTIHGKLTAAFPKLYPACSPFLADLFPTDPAVPWNATLTALHNTFSSQTVGIQYYYDLLRDLTETWNDFRSLLFGERSWCTPAPTAFPKHLLLGNPAATGDQGQYRTPFYPAPLTSRTSEQLDHARFLIMKLDTLIRTFQLPIPQDAVVRITPSRSGEHPLEERAIPYYYQVNSSNPIHRNWSYRLHRQGMDDRNYSYNALQYRATGAAANPLAAQIAGFGFFRIEGHLGQPVKTVVNTLENEIKAKNLPIAVRAVMLGPDRTKVVKRPGIRYTDLHRLHYLLRQDVSHQLEDVVRFSQNFKQKVDKAVRDSVVSDSPDDATAVTLKNVAKDQNATVARNAAQVRAKLNRSYSSYKADTTWKQGVAPAMQAAGQFKSRLSDVVKTEFSTPFDSLIANTHIQWLDWLDDIIKARDDHEDDKLLFATFIASHPGIEHCGGVTRGGTFVLVHDENQTVVADFMLPYYCCDIAEEEPAQPPLKKPGLRPGWIVGNGITVLPSRDKFVKGKLEIFRTNQLEDFVKTKLATFKEEHVDILKENLTETWNRKFDSQQQEYFGTMKESVNLLGNALISRKEATVDSMGNIAFTDKTLEQKVGDAKEKQLVRDYLLKKADQSDLSTEQKTFYEQQAKEAETELAAAITGTAKYIAESKINVSAGSEGMAAMLELQSGLQSITDDKAATMVTDGFNSIKSSSTNTGLNLVMDSMIALRRR
ncbi:MAG: hypothetical protein CXR30_11085 [Geobacter sp.]|nr:MAG: hypothetical protein CXR30_11085 [Geobacter sp.]